jgi:hypothetical protein
LFASLVSFTHPLPQSAEPVGHAQLPPAQTCPLPHTTPQPPQFNGSFNRSVHTPLQVRSDAGQRHMPPTQFSA